MMATKQKELTTMEPTELVEHSVNLPNSENPLHVYQSLVASGTDPDKLAKLLDLQERWERNQAVKLFSDAKLACKAELPVVVRDKMGEKGKYPSLEHVSRTIDPIVTKHGFTHDFGTKESTKDHCITVTLTVSHVGGHSEHRELVDIPHDVAGPKGTPNKSALQGVVSSVSFAQRKLKLMYWDITVADEDKDGNQPKESISDDEVGELNDLIASAAEATAQMPKDILDKVLDAFQIESLDKLPKMQLATAKRRLTKTIQSGGR